METKAQDTGPVTAGDIAKALYARGAGDPKWDWLTQEAGIMLEAQAAEIERLGACDKCPYRMSAFEFWSSPIAALLLTPFVIYLIIYLVR
jgi:hypothetical protein